MDTFEQVKKSVVEAAKDAKDTVVETAKDAKDAVVEAAKDAKEFVADRVEDAKNLAGDVAGKVKAIGQKDDNVLAILKKDHEMVSGYFDKLESLPAQAELRTTAEGLFAQLKYELETHATAEERLFYPSLEKNDASRQLIAKAFSQHQVVKQMLAELASTPIDAAWRAKLGQLKKNVQDHVDMEENQIFPLARSLFSEQQLEAMGIRIEREKEAIGESKTVPVAQTQKSGPIDTQKSSPSAQTRPGFPRKSTQGGKPTHNAHRHH